MAANSRYPTDEFAKRRAQEQERRIKMLEEAMTKTPKKEPSATGAPIGTTRVYTGLSVINTGVSTSSIQWTDDGWASEEAGGTPPAVTWDAGDSLRVVAAGFYVLTMRGRFWWNIDGTEPDWVTFDFRGDSNFDSATQGFQPYIKGSRREIEICHQFGGPWELAAGDAVTPFAQWEGSQDIQFGVADPKLDITRVA